MEGGKKIRSVDKAMALLELLGESRSPLTLSELERRSGLPKSTIHGLLSTMMEHHMVSQQADGRYCLGLRLFELGCAVSASWDVTGVAAPYLAKLSSVTGATAFLAVRSGGEAVTLDQSREGSGLRIVSETGCRLPLYCTSQGKLFLAYCSSEAEQARLLRAHPPVPHTPHTITDPDQLAQELRKIQAQGYAVEDGEFRIGLRSVSAPIFGLGGTLQYALGVVGLFRRTTAPEFTLAIRLATEYAAQISDELEALSGRP